MAKLQERNDKPRWMSILIIFSLIQSLFVLSSPTKAIQSNGEEVKIMAVMHWYPVGTDYDGSTLQENRNFPWESTDLSCWGRVDYPMTKTLKGPPTNPIFYTIVYVTVTAKGADSQVKEMVCIVLDDSGSIWLDPDGKFHNPHYDPVKDPANPLFLSGNCLQANQIEGRIRFSVDPFPGNNTQGPYSLQALLSGETIVFQYKGRRFLLGLLDREDYIELTTVGFKDWDHELPLIPFLDNEKYVENIKVNGEYDPFEWIYRTNLSHTTVEVGDLRLSPVVIPGTDLVYEPNSVVLAGDKDIGSHLNNFTQKEAHYDFFPFDGQYTNLKRLGVEFEPEFIYRRYDTTELKVQPGDTRLTPVNGRVNNENGLLKDFGLTNQDALILVELALSNTNQHYAVETNYQELVHDLNLSVSASSTSVGLKKGSTSLAQGVLVEEDPYVQLSYIQNLFPLWAGYIGFEWFLDNGRNNKMPNQIYREVIPRNLSDDFLINGQSEEIWGQYSRSGDLDTNLSLHSIPDTIRYYDVNSTGLGVNTPLYRDRDDSFTVSEGDERVTEVGVTQQNTILYLAGSFVTAGDADVGFLLQSCPTDVRFIDRAIDDPDFSNNGELDIGEPVYKKGSVSTNLGWVEANDFRITDVLLESITYKKGSYVSPCSFYYHQSKIWGLSQHLSGDFRNFETPVLKGVAPITITKDSPFQVELTTTLTVQFDEPIEKGQRVWIIIDGPSNRTGNTNNSLYQQAIEGPFYDWIKITLTPFLGSYSEKGAEFPMSILIWVDKGGCSLSLPILEDKVLAGNFYEPFYDTREKKYFSSLPKDFYPDTFTLCEELVLPEELWIQPSKKCISTFDSRFPNLWAKSTDVDNPDDVNDPYSLLTSYAGNALYANYNAHGAGIEYYATAYGYLRDQPNLLQHFIIQVNSNRTYYIFLWDDKAPMGVLNFGDTLSNMPIQIYSVPIWKNLDCSEKFYLDKEDWLGYNWITKNDALGCFDGEIHELSVFPPVSISQGWVETFGVNVMMSSYDSLSEGDPGGDFPIMLLPLLGDDSISFRLFTTSIQYDYNNTIQHPPDFIDAPYGSMQYRGFYTFKTPKIEDVNFTNLAMVDHALQYSEVNYTAGDNALSPLNSPILASPYNPLIMDYERDFIAYPAGQTNVGRTGFRGGNQLFRRSGMMGYNAYPAITAVRDPLSAFRKLGSENSPMADYSFYFTLQNKSGEFYRFNDDAPTYLRVDRIVVEGPMKTTKIIKYEVGSVVPDTGYPITYDYSGKLVIDRGISQWYQSIGEDWTGRIGFGRNEMFFNPLDYNPLLVRTKILDFRGFPYVFKIPEIIPTGGGRLHVTVYLADGTSVELGDCCSANTEPGIRVHGINVENVPDAIEMNRDHSLKPVLREYEDPQESTYCNNAFVYLWQDRGIRMYASMLMDPIEMGAGDGRINMNNNEFSDLNLDGKISFGDFETEIIGTYDLATNTWKGGLYDARTFNVDNGIYPLELTAATNTQITQFGSDFGNRSGKNFGRGSDHIISADEECPVYVTAYKYYDDNNDRAFTPLYRRQSHEVYLAGEKRILMKPAEDLIIDTYPSPLTAGCIPELIDKTTPLTFTVMDSSGKPMDFQFGVMDPQGESNVYTNDIHQHLFHDTPTEPLPQYYWTRTDLHNEDLGYDNNNDMYSKAREEFSPIQVDFTRSSEGKYSFKNFCANDEGIFEVKVYSPDHMHMGRTWVRVVNPSVEFQISPMELQGNRMQGMMSISDPDFVMTAGINRVYVIQMKAFNAQGQLIKGVDIKNPYRNADEKEEIVHSGHFIPYTSKPGSFDLPLKFKEIPSPYYLHVMFPGNQERIELSYSLIFALKGFGAEKEIYYNTTNVQYEDGLFSKCGVIEPNPTLVSNNGWGYGCIYNSPREGVYLFPDSNDDKKLTKEDTLMIGPDGIARVILFAEDVCHFGVLVGGNYFTDSEVTGDVVGKPPDYADDPLTIRRRYRKVWDNSNGYSQGDGFFYLDWDAFPETDRVISPPRLIIQDSETKFAFRRDLLSPMNYDLVYAIPNAIHLIIQPADNRDLPITKGFVRLQGNTAESYVYGSIGRNGFENATDILFTPTGVGENIAHLLYTCDNQLYNRKEPLFDGPGQYAIDLQTSFDSVRALQLSFPAGNTLLANLNNEMTIRVTEKGTNAPVYKATVSVSFSNYAKIFTTNEQGEVTILISPKENDSVRVYVIYKDALEEEVFLKVVSP